jgi:hypothetical protein
MGYPDIKSAIASSYICRRTSKGNRKKPHDWGTIAAAHSRDCMCVQSSFVLGFEGGAHMNTSFRWGHFSAHNEFLAILLDSWRRLSLNAISLLCIIFQRILYVESIKSWQLLVALCLRSREGPLRDLLRRLLSRGFPPRPCNTDSGGHYHSIQETSKGNPVRAIDE